MGRVDDAFDRVLGGSVAIKHLLRSSDDPRGDNRSDDVVNAYHP